MINSSSPQPSDFDAVQTYDSGSHEYRKKMKKCMGICSAYAVVSVVAVVMEVFALMALQFCDGEDLMPLYWSTWTMLQVGALIAIFGILLSVFNGLRGNKNPPWALALGTPVLVVAGLGHAVHGAMRKRVQKVRSRSRHSRDRGRGMSVGSSVNVLRGHGRSTSDLPLPMSREATIRVDDSEREDGEYRAKLVGYTTDGSPIIQFMEDPPTFKPERGSVIGKSESGQVIVAFRKNMTVMTDTKYNRISYGGAGGGDGVAGSSIREKSRSNSLVPTMPSRPPSLLQPTTNGSTILTTPRATMVRIASPGESLPPV